MKSQMRRIQPLEYYEYAPDLKVLMIPDTHWEPEHKSDSLKVARALGWLAQKQQVDVVVHIGDANDLGSLSSYDIGRAGIEGKRLRSDLRFSKRCLEAFRDALRGYEPDLYLTLGNHEERLYRLYEEQPQLHGVFGDDPFGYEEAGWHVLPYRHMLGLNGTYFSHYFQNPTTAMNGPISGNIETCIKNVGHSFVQGHTQTLKMGQIHRANGDIHCGLIAGACYIPDHGYKGPQGNNHWKGAVTLSNMNDGYYDVQTHGLKSLLKEHKNA